MKRIMIISSIVLVAGVGFYLISAPFKTNVDMKMEQATKWTPENIQKDPVGYLAWGIANAEKTIDALKAREIAVIQQINKADTQFLECDNACSAVEAQLNRHAASYKQAAEQTGWPCFVNGHSYDQKELKRQIISLDRRLKSEEIRRHNLDALQQKLSLHRTRIKDELRKAQDALASLQHQQEVVKTETAVADLEGIQGDVSAVAGIADLMTGMERMPSVDTLIQEEQSSVSDDEFESIIHSAI